MFKLCVSALALVALSATARAETGFLDRSVTIKGETFRYQVYVPLEFTKSKKWPVIVALH